MICRNVILFASFSEFFRSGIPNKIQRDTLGFNFDFHFQFWCFRQPLHLQQLVRLCLDSRSSRYGLLTFP